MAEITITEYLDTPITKPRAIGILRTLAWTELLDYLLSRVTDQRTKGAAGYWVAAPVPGPRSNAAALPTRVVALDWDDAPVDWDALRGVAYVAHTTDSHTDAAPRWRVWVLLDREYSAEEVSRARCPWPGAHLRAISQPAYVPTTGDDTEYCETWNGQPLRLSEWWPARPTFEEAKTKVFETHAGLLSRLHDGPRTVPSQASTNALVTRWLSNPDGTNRLAGALGSVLAEWQWTDAEIASYLSTWLHADPRLSKHTDDALRGAAKRRAGDRIVGFPALAEAGVEFRAEAPERPDLATAILEAQANAKAGDAPGPPFYLRSAADICDRPLPDIQWVCEALSLAPGAPALCVGYSGVGKTTALQDLALAVATPGRLWLNQFAVRHGSVAHVDLEQGEQQTYRTYRALGATREAQLDCSILPQWRLTDPENMVALAGLAVGRVLIIIDSFRAASPEGDENASEYAAPMAELGRISELTGCTFVLNHHSGKNSDRGPMKGARGTSAITAACSVHWSFERDDLSPDVRPCLKLIKSRNHATDAMVWETYVEKVGSAEAFSLHARAEQAPEREDVELDASILREVEYGSVRNIGELSKAVGRRKAEVCSAAKRLGVAYDPVAKTLSIIPK